MGKRGHRLNPAKIKVDVSALDQSPPPEVFDRRLELRRRLSVALLCLLTVVLLSVSFSPFGCWPLAYAAMVPWMSAMAGGADRKWTILWGWLTGLLFWAANLYWLWWITLTGYSAGVLYLSVYWLAAALVIRPAMARDMPMSVVFPVVWVALEFVRAYVVGGFPWFYLAHSQYLQTRLIQISDLTGQYGVSFFVAAVNGVIVDALVSPLFVRSRGGPRMTRKILAGLAGAAAAAGVLLAYGSWRLNQERFSPGPVIGVVQCSFRNTLTGREKSEQEIFQAHLNLMHELETAGCDLVIIPETMLPQGINADVLTVDLIALDEGHLRGLAERFVGSEAWEVASAANLRRPLAGWIQSGFLKHDLGSLTEQQIRTLVGNFGGGRLMDDFSIETLRKFLRDVRDSRMFAPTDNTPSQADYAIQVGQASRALGCPILAGGVTWHRNDKSTHREDEWLLCNSAMWFDQTWQCSRIYSKMHLVPFSEYVPFKGSWPWLYRRLRWFVPKVMSQVEPGEKVVRFDLERPSGSWQLVTPICYEGTFARVCRAMVRDGPKDRLIMANLSNDGWFVWQSASGVNNPSNEHSQHLASYCFRAIENRVPVVRAVNTGISASIDSNGRIAAVLERYGRREVVNGTLLLDGSERKNIGPLVARGPKVLVDSRISAYSRVGDIFAMLVSLAALALTARILLGHLRSRKARSQ